MTLEQAWVGITNIPLNLAKFSGVLIGTLASDLLLELWRIEDCVLILGHSRDGKKTSCEGASPSILTRLVLTRIVIDRDTARREKLVDNTELLAQIV